MNTAEMKSTGFSEPIWVGSASRTGRLSAWAPLIDIEFRLKLTPGQARVMSCLPLVGPCVRRWRVAGAAGDWNPHPSAPGVEIQFAA